MGFGGGGAETFGGGLEPPLQPPPAGYGAGNYRPVTYIFRKPSSSSC